MCDCHYFPSSPRTKSISPFVSHVRSWLEADKAMHWNLLSSSYICMKRASDKHIWSYRFPVFHINSKQTATCEHSNTWKASDFLLRWNYSALWNKAYWQSVSYKRHKKLKIHVKNYHLSLTKNTVGMTSTFKPFTHRLIDFCLLAAWMKCSHCSCHLTETWSQKSVGFITGHFQHEEIFFSSNKTSNH